MKKILLLNLMILLTLTISVVKTNAQVFTEQAITGLPNIGQGHSTTADYDNDGKMDLLITGDTSATVYISYLFHNEGNGNYKNVTALAVPGLPGVKKGCVAWGDYNNDGYIDFVISGYTASGNIIKLYKNNGNGTFTEQKQASFYPLSMPSLAWGDYNNDGLPDLLISGSSNTTTSTTDKNLTTRLYRNNGDGTFTDVNAPFTGLDQTSAAWFDYDNDGFLDCIISGYTGTTAVFKNNGDGTFTAKGTMGFQTNMIKVNCFQNSMSIGDYNHDGYLDILESGNNGASSGQKTWTRVYKNKGDGTGFVVADTLNLNLGEPSVAWADFDNDGWVDVLASGQSYDAANNSLGIVSKVYRYNTVTKNYDTLALALPGRRYNSSFWFDYNNDKKLDFFLIGTDNAANSYTGKAKLYLSSVTTANQLPTAPSNLTDSVSTIHNNVMLRWDKSLDPQTNTKKGITYNLRVFTKSGGKDKDIISPMADTVTGARRIPVLGSITGDTTQTKKTSYLLKGLKPGTYYWRVQAINESFFGSPWSAQDSFIIVGKQQASNITFTNITPSTIRISWINGDYGQRVVMVDSGMIAYNTTYSATTITPGMPILSNNTTYTGNAAFGTGTRIGTTGWYCVYNGTGNYVDITGLNATNTSATGKHYSLKYAVAVLEYAGSAGSENYNINAAAGNSVLMPPLVNASNIQGSGLTATSFTATWKNGSGSGRSVFVHQGTAASNTNIPISNNINYIANAGFSSGQQIDVSGWYCVYNGTGTSVNITGLQGLTTYTVRVCEYNTFSGVNYLPQDTISNPIEFTTADYSAPAKQATNVQITNVTSTNFDVKCNKGNGSKRVMFVYKGTSGTTAPVNNTTYTANAAFGSGTQVGTTGWYCIYNGTDSVVTVTGINSVNSYVVKVCEYNGIPGLEKYITSDTVNNPGALINNRTDQTITMVTNTAKTFGDADFDLAATASSGLPVSYSSSDATIATIVSGMVHIVGAGKCIISALQPGDINYNPAPGASDTLVVSKAASTITFDPLSNKTMIDAPFAVSATSSSGLPVTFTSSTPLVATLSGSTVTIVGMGTDTIIASQVGDNNYLAASPVKRTFVVTKVPQTITFDALPNVKSTDPDFKLVATASSGLKVIFKCSDLTVAAVQGNADGDSIHIFGAGIATITASQSGNNIYLPASPVTQTLTVTYAVGIPQLTDGEDMVYPNPASNNITISLGSSLMNSTIGIYSLTGQQMSMVKVDNSVVDINVSDLKPGIYLVKIINASGVIVKQIVKQ